MKNITFHHQTGITLIELMIALALGLIVSAAAIMLFLTGQKSYSLQQGVADLQDSANFGLDYIVRDIRLSNLNTVSSEVNDETSEGGIVLTSSVNGKKQKTLKLELKLLRQIYLPVLSARLLRSHCYQIVMMVYPMLIQRKVINW